MSRRISPPLPRLPPLDWGRLTWPAVALTAAAFLASIYSTYPFHPTPAPVGPGQPPSSPSVTPTEAQKDIRVEPEGGASQPRPSEEGQAPTSNALSPPLPQSQRQQIHQKGGSSSGSPQELPTSAGLPPDGGVTQGQTISTRSVSSPVTIQVGPASNRPPQDVSTQAGQSHDTGIAQGQATSSKSESPPGTVQQAEPAKSKSSRGSEPVQQLKQPIQHKR